MFEKVNPSHPDKVADRIAGAIVDYAYTQCKNPRIAVEVLIGHRKCYVIAETSVAIPYDIISGIVERISGRKIRDLIRNQYGDLFLEYTEVPQDEHLAANQEDDIRCGDNGIFKGTPVTVEQHVLTDMAHKIYREFGTDGKYILDGDKLVICQSCATDNEIMQIIPSGYRGRVKINPLGYWTGGTDVDTGATNRKLGSDMGDSVTGGGLHGKDLSKADVSVNIYAWLKAQHDKQPVELSCAIGDTEIDGKPYREIVEIAKDFIGGVGGFERFAEWGLIRIGG